ncbi:hypothetical protein AB0L63_31540 [Nocardia sp. NPDC051990]|uniref:hypothetical protein n=1 Tax=Nocardia sp. NPDC051990 TaxID=3155285 RepID=UPI003447D836
MSWPEPRHAATDPAYYHDASDRTEARIRADFTRYYQLRLVAPFAETPGQKQEFTTQADDLAARWGRHSSIEHRRQWEQLQAAVSGWELRPEATRAAYTRIDQAKSAGQLGVDALVWRNLRQAAEVTGHIETTITGSDQDGARWRPPEDSAGRDVERSDLLERALGGRGPELRTLAEVDAIIAETDELLAAEEELGDLDTGADERAARQRAALRRLQDLTAKHAWLSEHWDGSPEQDQTYIARLESLLAAARTARCDAADAGAPPADIEAAYRAGRDGTYRHEHTGDAQLEPNTQPEHNLAVYDSEAEGFANPRDGLPNNDRGGGAAIDDATAAALPGTDFAEWPTADDFDENPATIHRLHGVDADLVL